MADDAGAQNLRDYERAVFLAEWLRGRLTIIREIRQIEKRQAKARQQPQMPLFSDER